MNDLKVISTEIKDEEKDKEPTWISTFTQKGINLLAKLQAGTSLNITRVVSGAGYVNPDALPIQTQVTDPRKEFITGNVTYANERARIPISLDNRGVTSPYSQWQIGTYVQDPDEGEILYCISQTREPDHVPTQTQTPGWIINIGLNILYGNADRVNVTIDPTGMVSNEDMVAHELDVQAHQPAMNAHDQSEIAHAPAFLKHNTSDIAHANRFDDVYAQLGNKVNKATGYGESYSPSVPSDDCNQISVTGVFRAANTTQNTFSESAAINAQGEIIYHACWDNRAAFQLSNTGGRIGFRRKNGGAWGPWKQLTAAEPATIFALPLTAGIQSAGSCTYSKDQLGTVIVHFRVKKSGTSNDLGNIQIATLPVGFRPNIAQNESIWFPVGGMFTDTTKGGGYGFVTANGEIYLNNERSNMQFAVGNFCFTSNF